jgi:hypothetical protein
MKTILLLMCTLFLISQVSFGKEMNTKTPASNNEIKLERIVFKNSSVSKKALIEKHRIWLNFSNAEGAFKQLLVGYATGATNGWDKLFDSVTIDSNPYVDFYSINLGKRLTIQGRALPFLTTDEIPLGYKTTIVGTFNITIDHVDGLFVNQDIFLKDLVTGVTHNLKNGTYSFTTAAGRFDDRFVLLYINSIPLPPAPPAEPIVTDPVVTVPVVPTPVVTDPVVTVPVVPTPVVTDPDVTVPVVSTPVVTDPVVTVPVVPDPFAVNIEGKVYGAKGKSIVVSVNDSQVTINSVGTDINEVLVYSTGQIQLFERKNINANEFVIDGIAATKQVLIIKTHLRNGKWATSKVIL